MTASIAARPARPPWRTPGRAVVAGVDGSAHNAAAIEYAAELAERTHRILRLTAVVDGRAAAAAIRLMRPGGPAWGSSSRALHQDRAHIADQHPTLRVAEHIREGSPVSGLVDAAREEAALVVGRRGVGATERMLGSTSVGVAGRSVVPVVVVPDEWRGAADPKAPVVAALHPGAHVDTLLDYAFTEAQETGAPLTVVRIPQPQEVTP
jgi:nucleotide-binding universal stress UspA family protein